MKNFHLPLPELTYAELRAEAERIGRPATTIAREAITLWLRARERFARRKAIAESAAVEELLDCKSGVSAVPRPH